MIKTYSDDYLKTSGILQQYCRDEQATDGVDDRIGDFTANDADTNSFKIRSNKKLQCYDR